MTLPLPPVSQDVQQLQLLPVSQLEIELLEHLNKLPALLRQEVIAATLRLDPKTGKSRKERKRPSLASKKPEPASRVQRAAKETGTGVRSFPTVNEDK